MYKLFVNQKLTIEKGISQRGVLFKFITLSVVYEFMQLN